ncbi:GNVR domain-containing protein [uncultured Desulfobacter sp.]|uniref:GumC family protein n=1 Tax=uncultured Desulfobacter sp. TaxID=240139 RepID=UPI0029C70E27|nr:GNVR domain-containing protein [uncultured Desulfobacter sp.]
MTNQFQSQAQIKPDYIIDVLIRGRWFLIVPLCISLTLGLGMTLTANKTYEASTMILVQPQRVPTSYIRSVVSSDINQRISTISQQVLSRSNLEQIIDQFGLFEDSTGMYQEEKISGLRKRIKVKTERARQGAESFSISFTGSEPQRVMRIANTLASYFMDENLKVREAQAIGTSEFLDSELEKTQKRLEEKEQKLAAFRAKYLGGLPDELETNLRTLDRMQKQVTDKAILLREVNNSISQLDSQISSMAATNDGFGTGGDDFLSFDFDESQEEGDDPALQAAQEKYDALLLRYTEKHPDVKKLKRIIEKLKKDIEAAKAEDQSSAGSEEDVLPDMGEDVLPGMGWDPVAPLKAQRAQLVVEANNIQAEVSAIQEKMKIYQQRVEDTPKRELEIQSLKRDYGNIQDIYNSLLDRKLEAELSVNMEKKQKGEQFRILDYARLPEKPISPNVKMMFLLSVAGGLGLGGGVLFLKELLTFSVIRRDDQIETELGLPILASIPPLQKPGARTKQKIEWIMFICCCSYSAVFLAFFAILNQKGLDRTINFIKTTLNL